MAKNAVDAHQHYLWEAGSVSATCPPRAIQQRCRQCCCPTVAPRRPLDETALRIVVVGRQHCAIDVIANGLLDRGGSRLHQMIVVVVVVVILQYRQGFRERQGEC